MEKEKAAVSAAIAVQEKPTIREILRENELDLRAEEGKQTKFDKPVDILRTGEQINIPKSIRPEKASEMVKKWADGEAQTVAITEYIEGVPIDAAHALMLAVKKEYGVVELKERETWFGTLPPPFFSVPTSAKGENVEVYVGEFTLPGFEKAKFASRPDDDNIRLAISATLRRKDVPLFNQLLDTARAFLQEQSLYKGRAITIDFKSKEDSSDGGSQMFIPRFWDLEGEKPLILDRDTERMINATIWTPIKLRAQVKAMGTPIKRGVLLWGTFGTGKTLTAYETARIAVEHGYTFLYVKDVAHLQSAIDFASKQLLPAIVFMEDTERAFENPERVNAIQNTMDGIDGKDRDLIIVLTTNHVEQLPPAIMRPGRLDTIIQLKPADDETAARLVKFYAGALLDPESDFVRIGAATSDNIPATIREIVERAKLFALARTQSTDFLINHEDIEVSALGMKEHLELLGKRRDHAESPLEQFGRAIGVQVAHGMTAGRAVRDASESLVTGQAMTAKR